jgi:CHAT domain-containing protein
MYTWLILSIIGAGIGLAIFLFLLEWMFPKDVHILNYALTDKTFKELYSNHHYRAAIFIAEGDTSYVNDQIKNIPNKTMLRDCYIHIGEYSKAEKIGRDFLGLNPDLSNVPNDEKELSKISLDVFHAVAARDLFRLYEKMGDRDKQVEMYKELKSIYGNSSIHKVNKMLAGKGYKVPVIDEEHSDIFTISHNLKYDIICGSYFENPDAAIDSLKNYLNEVWQIPQFKSSLKLEFVNRLISWYLEKNDIFQAQQMLLNGIYIVQTICDEKDLDPLGDFAEYCYILHDYKNARRFMNIYMRFMDKHYSKDDMEYLLAEVRFVKYQNDNTSDKIDALKHCCRGLREQISNNFAGMTSSQQDYFAQKLKEPFSYALELLEEQPNNEDLAELCFENEVFNRGLLMRTDALLRQALLSSGDSSLIKDYEQFIGYKRELIARDEVVGPGNFARRMYLKQEIAKLEKQLSVGSSEFARSNYSDIRVKDIKSSLSSNESLITYVEIPHKHGTSLGAFVLNKENGLQYISMCSSEELISLEEIAQNDILKLCVDNMAYHLLFEKIDKKITDEGTILYSPAGIVHRIPLKALYIDNDLTIGDKYKLSALANPIDLYYQDNTQNFAIDKMKIALWGGIDYGTSDTKDENFIKTRSVTRGESLVYLPGSLNEVDNIYRMLDGKVLSAVHFTGNGATESSFKQKASGADIIHISTHGFFHEDQAHELNNAMHNSGLFFANANAAWKDNYKPEYFYKGYEDGILRADEIETQDLASCKLVVLSACETGLGEIKGDEGVFGLQRAFKLAGARCILMSLWSVPDAATEELMKRFYENLLIDSNIDNAFNNAQKSMKESTKPLYGVRDWGGFVLLH